jgi:cytochrome c peroxidase
MLLAAAPPAGAQDGTLSVSSDDLYQEFKTAFEAAGGARNIDIRVGPMRGLTPQSDLSCRIRFNLPAGTVRVGCTGVAEPTDVYLVANQPVEGDTVLAEAHDQITLAGSVAPGGTGFVADLGSATLSAAPVDVVVLVAAGGDPTSPVELLAVGFPTAFQHRFWSEQSTEAQPQAVQRSALAPSDPRVRLGLVSADVLAGADLFFRETFDGNSRTCGTCHPASNNLMIDPKFVKQLRQADLADNGVLDDPLFVAHPNFAGTQVKKLEVPFLLNQEALIRENVDGMEDADVKFTMRGVPTSLSMATSITPPDPVVPGGTELPDGTSTAVFQQRTGWSGDGAPAPGTLNAFSVGATIQHFRRKFGSTVPGPNNFRLPTTAELNQIEQFMLTSGRTADIDLTVLVMAEPQAEAGRGAFATGNCGFCHNQAGANFRQDGRNRNFDTQAERILTPGRVLYLERTGTDIPCDGGFAGQNGTLDGFNFESQCGVGKDTVVTPSGINDAFGDGTFNTLPLIEAADTGPFFHNNGEDTLEEAIAFYRSVAFSSSPASQSTGITFGLPEATVINQGAFLRSLNAAFNMRIAEQRCAAVAELLDAYGDDYETKKIVNQLIVLANEELDDARKVLRRADAEIDNVPLNLTAIYQPVRQSINGVMASNTALLASGNTANRLAKAQSCATNLKAARESMTAPGGPVLDFPMGEANLTF